MHQESKCEGNPSVESTDVAADATTEEAVSQPLPASHNEPHIRWSKLPTFGADKVQTSNFEPKLQPATGTVQNNSDRVPPPRQAEYLSRQSKKRVSFSFGNEV